MSAPLAASVAVCAAGIAVSFWMSAAHIRRGTYRTAYLALDALMNMALGAVLVAALLRAVNACAR